MDAYEETFVLVEYHVDDGYDVSWGYPGRWNFYDGYYIPETDLDGLIEFVGAKSYNTYRNAYEDRRATPTNVHIEMVGEEVSAQTYQITARVCMESQGSATTMRFYMVHVLDNYACSYCRNTFRQAASIHTFTLDPGECVDIERSFTFDSTSWNNQEDIKIVAWVQTPASGYPAEVYQAAWIGWPFPPPCEPTDDCDDGIACTLDECIEPEPFCMHVPQHELCDDSVECTDDVCDPWNDCQGVPDHGFCSNGIFCDGVEHCNTELDCLPGIEPDCDDGVGCTDDICNVETDVCDHTPDNGVCANGVFCDGVEMCDPVEGCQPGTDPCTADEWCEEQTEQCNALTARVFLLPAGIDPSTAEPGAYAVTAEGGEDLVFDVWVENTDPTRVRSWQVWFDCPATGGTSGSIDFVSNDVSDSRTDYIFYDLSTFPPVEHQGECDDPEYDPYTMGPRTQGVCTDPDQYPAVTDPVYLSTWTFHVSTDAEGAFTLRPYCAWDDGCTPLDRTNFVAETNSVLGFTMDTLEVAVPTGQCCDEVDCQGDYTRYDCLNNQGGTNWNADRTCLGANPDPCACSADAECVDSDPCTVDTCDPGHELADAYGCVNQYQAQLYGDIYPVPHGDGAVEGFDILCVLDQANDISRPDCLNADVHPCDGGDGAVEGFDILAVLDAANFVNWCSDPCP